MTTIRQGDVGTLFSLTMRDEEGEVVSLVGATSATIRFLKPDGTSETATATISATPADGTITYETVTDLFDIVGSWYWEVTIEYSASGTV